MLRRRQIVVPIVEIAFWISTWMQEVDRREPWYGPGHLTAVLGALPPEFQHPRSLRFVRTAIDVLDRRLFPWPPGRPAPSPYNLLHRSLPYEAPVL